MHFYYMTSLESNCTCYMFFLGCNDNEFTCRNGDCIAANRECDGREDCSDRSDEHSGCGKLL